MTMDDIVLCLEVLLGFVFLGILCCTLLNWSFWTSMMSSKWLSKKREESRKMEMFNDEEE